MVGRFLASGEWERRREAGPTGAGDGHAEDAGEQGGAGETRQVANEAPPAWDGWD